MLRTDIPIQGAAWYALRVKPRHERAVASALHSQQAEQFLPLYCSRRVWSDRIKEVELPLFAGYVFCRFEFSRKAYILRTPGVLSIVGFGNRPTPVPDIEMESLKTLVRSGMPLQPWPFLNVGEQVVIEHGALRGVRGIILELKDAYRIVVSIALLQRSIAVELDGALVCRVENRVGMRTEMAATTGGLASGGTRAAGRCSPGFFNAAR